MLDERTVKIMKRLQRLRLNLFKEHPFFASLVMHAPMALDSGIETALTDGEKIVFSPDFMETLDDKELTFIILHEVMHMALNHCHRNVEGIDHFVQNVAADIIVNSNILQGYNMDLSWITLKEYGESMHRFKGKEGYEYDLETLCRLMNEEMAPDEDSDTAEEDEDADKTGNGSDETSDPDKSDNSNESDNSNKSDNSSESGEEDGKGEGSGEGNGEEVGGDGNGDGSPNGNGTQGGFDDHSEWKRGASGNEQREAKITWENRILEANSVAKTVAEIMENALGTKRCGSIPGGMERLIKELTTPRLDWREILNDFVQEEITDYSFNPPDRRFQDSPFLLPDYNEKDVTPINILFMIDTSGSMSEKQVMECYSEVYGAIQQFGGKLKGWLGFFAAEVVEPKPFESEEDFKVIKAEGGGGTSFQCILDYVRDEWKEEDPPESIIILTDGYAPYPKEEDANGIPVLWIINNEMVTPPWGKIARLIE